MREQRLYYCMEKFLKKKLHCFLTGQRVGSKYVGYADVVGIRDLGGQYSGDIEVIAVEVKRSRYNFAKKLGQALGYSLFSHRCYLAIPLKNNEEFTLEEKEMATRLGLGLIAIKKRGGREVLTPPVHQPIYSLMLRMIEGMGYSKCNVCGTLMPVERWTESLKKAVEEERGFYIAKSIEDRPMLFTKRKYKYRWVIICNDCIEKLKLHKITNMG